MNKNRTNNHARTTDGTAQQSSNILENENMEKQSEDTELTEDQPAIDRKQELIGDALPSVVQFNNMENYIFQYAPGENNIPKYVLLVNDFEVLAFPDLFPYGSCGYNSRERSVKLPVCKYFQQRLLNVDVRFAQNIEYLFCAQHIIDLTHIQSEANLAVRLSRGRTLGHSKITAGLLRNPQVVQQLVRNQQAYKFLRNIRGSPPYWQHELHDVHAMLRGLGIPIWFLTLSAADLHWPEMIQAVAMQFGQKLSHKDVLNMSIQQRSKYLRQNLVTGVHMFQHRLESFFSQYLLSTAQPLGNITDYVIKIEFQMRGTPHAHCLIWVRDAPKIDDAPDDIVCQFIDKCITGTLPQNSVKHEHDISRMRYLQKHAHSDYCRLNRSCRFGFQKPISSKTIISRKPIDENKKEIIEKAKCILQKIQHFISTSELDIENMLTEEILHKLSVKKMNILMH